MVKKKSAKQFLNYLFLYLLSIVLLVSGTILLNYYIDFFNATSEYNKKNYSQAISKLKDGEKGLLNIDQWKRDFAIADSFYQLNNFTDAQDRYELARENVANLGDSLTVCKIDTNISYMHEKNYQVSLNTINKQYPDSNNAKKNEKADLLNNIVPLLEKAIITRKTINDNCLMLGGNFVKTNQSILDSDKDLYKNIALEIYRLNGTILKSNIAKELDEQKIVLQNSKKEEYSNNKLNQLLLENNEAQKRYQEDLEKSQAVEKSKNQQPTDDQNTDQKIVKPW